MATNDIELVANFCNHSEDPPFLTLPVHFCDYNIFCEEFVRRPVDIVVVLVGVVIVVYALVVLIWIFTLHHIVGKFIDLQEEDRIKWMLDLAGQVSRRQELEKRFREDTKQHAVAPTLSDFGKEAPATP